MKDTSQRRRWSRFSLRTFFVLITLFALGCWWLLVPGSAFDADAWKDEQQVERGVRLQMADRFVARNTLRGMTRAEVTTLLGESLPADSEYWIDSTDTVYYLGRERGFMGMEDEWLEIDFGNDDRVVQARIVVR